LKAAGYTRSGDAWLGTINVTSVDQARTLELRVELPNAFPDVLPNVYVSDFDLLGVVAHIESNGKVCLASDHSLLIDSERTADVVQQTLALAAGVVRDGLSGKSRNDLFDEFLAYWERGPIEFEIESLIETDRDGSDARPVFVGNVTSSEKRGSELVVAENQQQAESWSANRGRTITGDRIAALYLKLESSVVPPKPNEPEPLAHWLSQLKASASTSAWTAFQEWLTSVELPVLVAFGIPTPSSRIRALAAISIPTPPRDELKAARRAARLHRPSAAVTVPYIGAQPIQRVRVQRRDSAYLAARGGANSLLRRTVTIIGCGSVGSTVAMQLASMGVGTINLLDPESLSADNIHRHVLGLAFVGSSKATSLALLLNRSFPHQQAFGFAKALEEVCLEHEGALLSADVIIFATGDESLQRRFASILRTTRQVHVWVEPLGLGGHALSVAPREQRGWGCYECLFARDGAGKLRNAASFAEQGQRFQRTFAGCGGSHTPFSVLDVHRTALEASSLATALAGETESISQLVSWRGDNTAFQKQGFVLSSRGNVVRPGLRVRLASPDFARIDCTNCG
jgi:hypothetical protein